MHASEAALPPTIVILDITGEVCPMTFVRTRIALDRLPADSTLAVLLSEGEPLENVPRSATELGFAVEKPEPHPPGSGIWRVLIRRGGQNVAGG